MRKGIYRALKIKDVSVTRIRERVGGERVVVGIDVAKRWQYGALMTGGEVLEIWKWEQPRETRELVSRLRALGDWVEVVLESSGTYGDALCGQLKAAGIEVYQASTKRVKDAQEVYDGVPSRHDAKCAAVLAWLHEQGKSALWEGWSEEERDLRARVRLLELSQKREFRERNRLEGMLARHWPELLAVTSLENASTLELLMRYGGPRGVRADEAGSSELLRRVGRSFLRAERIQALVRSAGDTTGVGMMPSEEELLRYLAEEARRAQQQVNRYRRELERRVEQCPELMVMASTVGKVTSAALVSLVGSPRKYESAGSYQKSMGLNLKEVSSGQRRGQLSITKRGSGRARYWLYLASLRLIQEDEVIAAWYQAKVKRDGGLKSKAVVAVMRKLSKALWHVGRGEQFDSRLLIEVSRLELAA